MMGSPPADLQQGRSEVNAQSNMRALKPASFIAPQGSFEQWASGLRNAKRVGRIVLWLREGKRVHYGSLIHL